MSRTLLALSVASALMLSAAPAMAAGTTTGYGQTTPPPVTTTGYGQTTPAPATTTPKPSSGTGPSKETATPKATSSEPSSKSGTPSSSSTPSSSPSTAGSRSTLPFTGLDLRWVVGIGVLLLGAGLSIRLVQRRQRQDLGR